MNEVHTTCTYRTKRPFAELVGIYACFTQHVIYASTDLSLSGNM